MLTSGQVAAVAYGYPFSASCSLTCVLGHFNWDTLSAWLPHCGAWQFSHLAIHPFSKLFPSQRTYWSCLVALRALLCRQVCRVWTYLTCLINNQLFYTNRLWRLSQVTVLFLIAAALCVVAQTAATILVVRAFRMTSLEAFGYEQHLIIIIASISRATADIFTTIGIAGNLKKKSSSGTTAMTTIADRLIAWTLGRWCILRNISILTTDRRNLFGS